MTRFLISSIWTIVSSLGKISQCGTAHGTGMRVQFFFTWSFHGGNTHTHISHTSHTGAFAFKSRGFAMIFWHFHGIPNQWWSSRFETTKSNEPICFFACRRAQKEKESIPKKKIYRLYDGLRSFAVVLVVILPALFPAMLKSAGMHWLKTPNTCNITKYTILAQALYISH